MEAPPSLFMFTSTSPPKLLGQPFFPLGKTDCRRSTVKALNRGTNERDYGGTAGNLVDENMIILRVRIKEMKTSDACNNTPSHWTEWEKEYVRHHRYNNDIFKAVGLLQSFLMNIRPSLALGLVALTAMSVPFSAGVVMFRTVEMAKIIFSRIHLG